MFTGFFQPLGVFFILGSTLLAPWIGSFWSDLENRLLTESNFPVYLAPSRTENAASANAWSSNIGSSGQVNHFDLAGYSNQYLTETQEIEQTSKTSAIRPLEYMIGMTRYMDKGHFPRSPDFANLYRCILVS